MKIPSNILSKYKTFDPEADLFFSEFNEDVGGRVLEVGSQHSPIASMLSEMGFSVVGVDLRDSDQERNYLHIKSDFCKMPRDFYTNIGQFDIAISISAIEHFGLNTYGEGPYRRYYDVVAMRKIYDFLRPGGVCYITVPFGGKYVENNPHWRVYDYASFLERIVQDFSIEVFFTQVCENLFINGRDYKAGEKIDVGATLLNIYGFPNISCFAKLRKPLS